MRDEIQIWMADGSLLGFGADAKVNFSREQLKITIEDGSGITGIHPDRFSAMVQQLAVGSDAKPGAAACRIELEFSTGETKILDVPGFESKTVDTANHLLIVRGHGVMALANFDFLRSYCIGSVPGKRSL